MANKTQLDAVEQLPMALQKTPEMDLFSRDVFHNAVIWIIGGDGQAGTSRKTASLSYLELLKLQLK